MRKILIITMVLFVNIIVLAGGHKGIRMDKSYENGMVLSDGKPPVITYGNSVALDTSRRVPGLTTWWDYWTNGNNQRMVAVLGDTVLVSVAYIDSANASTTAGRVLYYQVSYNGGATWLSDPILLESLPRGGAYPDIVPVILSGSRTIVISGRQFDAGSRGFSGIDIILGAGSFTNTLVPAPGSDYFSCWVSSTEIGGTYQTPDTLWFRKFNYTNNTYGSRLQIAVPPGEIAATNARKFIASSSNGQNISIIWYDALTPVKLVAKSSTDGGNTFGSIVTVMPSVYTVNGDETVPWFGLDMTYKPGTSTVSAAFCTQPTSSVKGYKILFWSPTINGGNPVRVADWTNTPVLADTAWVFNSTALIQVGMTYISHPTLAYSSDGSRLYCVFSASQKDSIFYPGASASYLFNDIYSSYSANDGATWSTPVKLAFSAVDGDEIYPVLSKTGNTPGNFGLLYMLSGFPGSSSFNQTTTPRSRNYTTYTRIDPVTGNQIPIGINIISTNVPEAFSLKQNYPNPFNPSTTIRFDIAKSSKISIVIFDVTGRQIEQVVKDELVQAGTHEVKFNAGNLASGVYFYTLKADGFTQTRKMMLVK